MSAVRTCEICRARTDDSLAVPENAYQRQIFFETVDANEHVKEYIGQLCDTGRRPRICAHHQKKRPEPRVTAMPLCSGNLPSQQCSICGARAMTGMITPPDNHESFQQFLSWLDVDEGIKRKLENEAVTGKKSRVCPSHLTTMASHSPIETMEEDSSVPSSTQVLREFIPYRFLTRNVDLNRGLRQERRLGGVAEPFRGSLRPVKANALPVEGNSQLMQLQRKRRQAEPDYEDDVRCKDPPEPLGISVITGTWLLSLMMSPSTSTAVPMPPDEEIRSTIRSTLEDLHPDGDKELMTNVVFRCVKRRMPVHAASSEYEIHFSTLHPLVKTVRQRLGLPEPVKGAVVLRRRAHDEDSPPQKKERRSQIQRVEEPTPFDESSLPTSWREKMQIAVWEATKANNSYDDPTRRERLCMAVMEALSGHRTLRAAAEANNIGFSTVQSYFHRTRSIMETNKEKEIRKATGETEESQPSTSSKTPSPPPATSAPAQPRVVRLPSQEQTRMKIVTGADGVQRVVTLRTAEPSIPLFAVPQKVVKSEPVEAEAPQVTSEVVDDIAKDMITPEQLLGKQIKEEVLDADDTAQIASYERAIAPDTAFDSQGTPLRISSVEDMIVIDPDGYVSPDPEDRAKVGRGEFDPTELMAKLLREDNEGWRAELQVNAYDVAIEHAVKFVNLSAHNKERLKIAVRDLLIRRKTMRETASQYQFSMQMIAMYAGRARSIYNTHRRANQEIGATQFVDRNSYLIGPPLDPNDSERVARIHNVAVEAIIMCTYKRVQKSRLLTALISVLEGRQTCVAAAGTSQVNLNTLQVYVHRARQTLGVILPPQISKEPPIVRARIVAHPVMSTPRPPQQSLSRPIGLEEIDSAVTKVVQRSGYDDSGKQALYEAILMILTEDTPVMDAARFHRIPAGTLAQFLQMARGSLGISLKGPVLHPNSRSAIAVASTSSGTTSVPKIFTNFRREFASEDEIRAAIEKAMLTCNSTGDRREQIYRAVYYTVSGSMTLKDACEAEDIPPSTAHPYVLKVRANLGTRCPPSKSSIISNFLGSTDGIVGFRARQQDEEMQRLEEMSLRLEPMSIRSVMSSGDPLLRTSADGSRREFKGTKTQLREMISDVMKKFKYKGDREVMTDSLYLHFVKARTMTEICDYVNIPQTTLSTYARLVRSFLRVEEPIVITEPGELPEDDDATDLEILRRRAPHFNLPQLPDLPSVDFLPTPSPIQRLNQMTVVVPRDSRPPLPIVGPAAGQRARIVIRARPSGADAASPNETSKTVKAEPLDEDEGPPLLQRIDGASTSTAQVIAVAKTERPRNTESSLPMAKRSSTVPHKSIIVLSKLRPHAIEENGRTKQEMEEEEEVEETPQTAEPTVYYFDRKEEEEEETDGAVNVMQMHSLEAIDDPPSLYRHIIRYLLEKQYKSRKITEMRRVLDAVFIDERELSACLLEFPSIREHVVKVYINRTADIHKCITKELPVFLEEVGSAIESTNFESQASSEDKDSPTAPTRTSNRLKSKRAREESGELAHLRHMFPPSIMQPLLNYLRALNDVNFPVENTLIEGLMKLVYDQLPDDVRQFPTQNSWTAFVANFRETNEEFQI